MTYIKRFRFLYVTFIVTLISGMTVLANSSPIDPITLDHEHKKLNHSLSIAYIPNFTELTFIDPSNSHNYLQKTETMKYSFYNEYRVSENLSLTNSLFYDAIYKKEYLDGQFLTKLKENHVGVDIGMNYEWLYNYVNPSVGITVGYPSQLSISASCSLIRDPVIHTVGLNYNNSYNDQAQQWSLIQGLAL